MFGFKKKKMPTDDLGAVTQHLEMMGYDLLPYGAAVALVSLKNGYRVAETASHLAFTTLARDLKSTDHDIEVLASFVPHGKSLLELLRKYKDRNLISTAQWENDARVVYRLITVDEQQEEWIDKVLNDPAAGKERLATSRVEYRVL